MRLVPDAAKLPRDRRSVAVTLLVLIALTACSLARQGGAGALDTLWAEDGTTFLQELRDDGLAATLLRPYAGYVHLLPRLLIAAVGWLPVPALAAGVALVAAFTTAALALVVVAAARPYVATPVLRWALGAAVVLTPVAGLEVLNTVALLQWPLTAAAVWVALWRPQVASERVLAAVVLILALASAPLALVVVPLLIARAVLERDWSARAAPLAGLLAGALQVGVLLTAAQQPAEGPAGSPAALLALWSERVAVHGVVGVRGAELLWPVLDALLPGLVVVVLAVALVAGARRLVPERRLLVAALAATSVIAFCASVTLRGVTAGLAWPIDVAVGSGSRYAVAPVLLLLGALAVAADGVVADRVAVRRRSVVLLGLSFLLVTALVDLRLTNGRARGPAWSDAVAAARADCGDGRREVAVPHAPPDPPGRWRIVVDCATLSDGR